MESHQVNLKEKLYPIAGFEGLYSVTKSGKIYTHGRIITHKARYGLMQTQPKPAKFMRPNQSRGAERIELVDSAGKHHRYFVHTIVASMFLTKPKSHKGLRLNHIDGNRQNNKASNLEWATT